MNALNVNDAINAYLEPIELSSAEIDLSARHDYLRSAIAWVHEFNDGGRSANEDSDMTTFDSRKDSAEKKYAHDEELMFKAGARRNKLLGLWVAEKLGKDGADAEAYAKSVVMADFAEAGDDDVLRKVKADLDAAKVEISDHQIRRTMDELMARAITEVKTGA